MSTLEIKIKSVYGQDLNYPSNSLAIQFTELLQVKTLTQRHIQKIREMGYQVVYTT